MEPSGIQELEAERKVSTEATRARVADRPLRILHVITRLQQGGTEYGILKVTSGLNDGQFVHAICTTRGSEQDASSLASASATIFSAGTERARRQLLIPSLRRVMQSYKPDIVHSRNWGTIEAVAAARFTGVPVIIHSEHGYELDMLGGLPLRRRVLRRIAYAMSDCVFAVSAELRDFHARQAWISPARIRVVPNGVNAEKFRPRPEGKALIRKELGIPECAFLVGSVGRLVPIKDYPTLLHATHRLVLRGQDARVALAGTGPELENLQKLAGSLPELRERAHFLGASDRIPDFLNALDVFVVSSISEGMSNSLLEAMASGLPVVVSRTGSNPELVEEGVSGLLFNPGDVEGLTAGLQRLLGDAELRSRTGSSARKRVLERFRVETMLGNYRRLYLELAARSALLRDGAS